MSVRGATEPLAEEKARRWNSVIWKIRAPESRCRARLQQFRRPHRYEAKRRECTRRVARSGIPFRRGGYLWQSPRKLARQVSGQILGDRRKDIGWHQVRAPMDATPAVSGRVAALPHGRGRGEPQTPQERWIDLYQQHSGPATPIDGRCVAIDESRRQGRSVHRCDPRLARSSKRQSDGRSILASPPPPPHPTQTFVSCQEEYSLRARDLDAK